MNNKRFKMFISIVLIILLLAIAGFYIFHKLQDNQESYLNEYTPQEEISEEQFRSTIVKLYFKDDETKKLKVENKCVDAKDLITNPYVTLFNLLIQGPNDTTLSKTLPNDTRINSAKLEENILVLDISRFFCTKSCWWN